MIYSVYIAMYMTNQPTILEIWAANKACGYW